MPFVISRRTNRALTLTVTVAALQLWTEKTSRDFIEANYAWFLRTYDGYRYPVQRVDAVRYFLLLHYGGIYLDLDNVRLQAVFHAQYSLYLFTDSQLFFL